MITFNTDLGPFDVPTSFGDLTINQHEYLVANIKDQVAIAKFLTGWDEAKLSLIDVSQITPYLGFLQTSALDEVEPINIIQVGSTIYTLPEDIGEKSWAQKIVAFDTVKELDPVKTLCVYLQPLIFSRKFDPDQLDQTKKLLLEKDIDSVYSCVRFIYDQLKVIAENESKHLNLEPTHEQKRAGIKMFNALGDFNVIDEMAQGKPWKYDEVLAIDYNTIFMKMRKNNITTKFERNYNQIINEKKPT